MTQNSTTCSAARKPAASAKWLVAPCLAACLCACGGGGNSSSSNPADNTPTNPEAPYTVDLRQGHLLSDTELKTPPIASASGLSAPTPDEQAWLAENHRPIRSISFDGDFSDIEFLAQELEGKRIVQLGESSHGTAEFSAVKVRVIKYLHEQLAYNVIAFESSIAGCHIQDQDLDLHPPKPRVGVECAFGEYRRSERACPLHPFDAADGDSASACRIRHTAIIDSRFERFATGLDFSRAGSDPTGADQPGKRGHR